MKVRTSVKKYVKIAKLFVEKVLFVFFAVRTLSINSAKDKA